MCHLDIAVGRMWKTIYLDMSFIQREARSGPLPNTEPASFHNTAMIDIYVSLDTQAKFRYVHMSFTFKSAHVGIRCYKWRDTRCDVSAVEAAAASPV
jgi:hypothetical protein